MKTCSTCHIAKPLTDFQVRRASRDGRTASCKSCLRTRDSARWHREKLKRMSAMRKYGSTPAGHAAQVRAKTRWADDNAVKRRAHIELDNAVRDGRMKQGPCLVCGSQPSQGHHFDYSRPLDVVWLCAAHHAAFHKIEREVQRITRAA